VEVEDVARVGLAAGRAAEEQGHLAIGDGLLGQIVVDDESVLTRVPEILSHGATRVGGEELEGGGVGRGGGDDDAVLVGVVLLEHLHEIGDVGPLLPARDVDAKNVGVLLVEDGIEGDGRLARLPVADDELALAAADGDEGVDALEARHEGFVDGLAGDDAGSLELDAAALALDRAEAVDGPAEAVDDAAEEGLADGDIDDPVRPLDDVALADLSVGAEDDDADVVLLEVEGHALDARRLKRHQLTRADVGEAVDARNAVSDGEDATDLGDLGAAAELGDAGLDDAAGLGKGRFVLGRRHGGGGGG